MNPQEREEIRSILTPALIANNQYGLTAKELDEEIKSLYGQPLKLPAGISSLEQLISKEFHDEFITTRRPNDGVVVFKVLPKADTSALLALVSKQKKSKPPKKNAKRSVSRPASSLAFYRHPPAATSFSHHHDVRSSTFTPKVVMPPIKMPAFVKPILSPRPQTPASPAPAPGSGFITAFNNVFHKMREAKNQIDGGVELAVKVKGVVVTQVPFPISMPDTLATFERLAVEVDKFVRKPSGRDSGVQSTSPTIEESVVSVVPSDRLPSVGSILRRVSVVDLPSLRRFLVQVTTPKGKTCLLPCTLFDVEIVDEPKAINILQREINRANNVLEIIIKAHQGPICQIDLVPGVAGMEKHVGNQHSLIKTLINESCVKPLVTAAMLAEPAPAPIFEVIEQPRLKDSMRSFKAHVTAVLSATSICLVLDEDFARLTELETSQKLVSKVISSFSDIKSGSICLAKRPNGTFVRARVESKNAEKQEVLLWLLDHGGKMTAKIGDLSQITEKFCKEPAFAFEVEIVEFSAYATCEQAVEIVKEQIMGATYNFDVISMVRRRKAGKSPLVQITASDLSHSPRAIRSIINRKLFVPFSLVVGIESSRANVIQTSVVDSKLCLFVRPVSSHAEKVFEHIQDLIANLVKREKEPPNFATIKEGDEVAGLYEGYYYRCRVLQLLPCDMIRVFFYDYGNEEEIRLTDLNALPAYLQTEALPRQVVKCQLADIPNDKKWRKEAASILDAEGVFDNPVDVKVVSEIDPGDFAIIVWTLDGENKRKTQLNSLLANREDLLTSPPPPPRVQFTFEKVAPLAAPPPLPVLPSVRSHSVAATFPTDEGVDDDVEEELEQLDAENDDVWTTDSESVSTSVSEPPPTEFATTLPKFEVQNNTTIEAICLAFIAPDSFQCRIFPDSEFKKSQTTLQTVCNSKHYLQPCEKFEIGDLCLAYHENAYHRAQIVLVGTHSCRVGLVDEGSQQIVLKQLVFRLPTRFAEMPPRGFVFTLAGVPERLSDYFQKQLANFGTEFCEKMSHLKITPSKVHMDGNIVKISGDALIVDGDGKSLRLMFNEKFVRPGKTVSS